jgi:hypothetical protein
MSLYERLERVGRYWWWCSPGLQQVFCFFCWYVLYFFYHVAKRCVILHLYLQGVNQKGVDLAQSFHVMALPGRGCWWLEVRSGNSWRTSLPEHFPFWGCKNGSSMLDDFCWGFYVNFHPSAFPSINSPEENILSFLRTILRTFFHLQKGRPLSL